MRQYDEYKDTGIEWLPKLPSHWQLEQKKRITTLSQKILVVISMLKRDNS